MSAADEAQSAAVPESISAAHRFLADHWLRLLAMIGAGIYFYSFAQRGWFPTDEGLLTHSAERVLSGELPHRDFDEVYTGGLSFLHALAFRAWGVNLWSLRIMLLLLSIPFVAVVYTLAVRVVSPLAAFFVTLLCVGWSMPNYFASMPSWYNLFFATFGVWTLLGYLDTRHARWLVAAGLCGGLSLTVKIVGFYYVAAVLLFLVDCERRLTADVEPDAPRATGFWLFVTLSLALFVAALAWLVKAHWGPMTVLLYVVPGALLAAYLSYSEWQLGRGSCAGRLKALFGLLIPFGLGLAVPVGGFVLLYAVAGALPDLYRGVVVLPQLRLTNAAQSYPLPDFVTVLWAVPYAVLLIWPIFRPISGERWLVPILAGVLLIWLALCGLAASPAFRIVGYTTRPLVVALAAATVLLLLRNDTTRRLSAKQGSQVFLLSAMAAMLSLVQYPFAHYLYFCYCAPLLALAIVHVVAAQPAAPQRLHGSVWAFYLLFAAVWLNSNFSRYNSYYQHSQQNTLLDGDRGRVLVDKESNDLYSGIIGYVQARTSPGDYIYAAPDCPEIYFLTARHNPTRTMYDMFDDPRERVPRVLAAIDGHAVDTVVINCSPQFAGLDLELKAAIEARFPVGRQFGEFLVLHRLDTPPRPPAE